MNELASQLEKNPRTIERIIEKLKQNNKIKRVGSDKTGTWEIV